MLKGMYWYRFVVLCLSVLLCLIPLMYTANSKTDSKKTKRTLHQIKKAINTTKQQLARLRKTEQQRQNRLQHLESESKSLQRKAGQLASRLSQIHDSTTVLVSEAAKLYRKDSVMRKQMLSLSKFYLTHNLKVSPYRYDANHIAKSFAIKAAYENVNERRNEIRRDYHTIVSETIKLDSLAGNNEIELNLTTEQRGRLDQEIGNNARQLEQIRKNTLLMEKELQEKTRSASKLAQLLKQMARERKKLVRKSPQKIEKREKQSVVPKSYKFSYPLESIRILRNYGMYRNEKSGVVLQNPGIDLMARTGTKALSSAEGVVSLVYKLQGYNTIVIIEHENGIRTVYGNLFKTYVRKGDNVQKGQPIGITGETIDGEYLHFEVWRGTNNVNPVGILR